ncbi:hypothetical protein Plo01_64890 [Planobispora longispora]|uniref:SLC26A/SulP transporter domain-containing protein n=1 Tax=Planobispora longispora TaxID=28887 RepID=A0A8J3W8M9_9ACTN|nr:SulP family inorganic anion transporter [Planobispora longispora]BFE79257.1 hypothetical protein GCM10020093_018580 [Planobispora longispora]GIH80060.1 hypothetical protein Plo01_64890 [Planobispora longispora]
MPYGGPSHIQGRRRAALITTRPPAARRPAGLVVALALIPEAISFSIIAGVDPSVGLSGGH